ncbi:MAG: hypothetical protein ACOY5V_11625 [Pseudomonadota bacterium]
MDDSKVLVLDAADRAKPKSVRTIAHRWAYKTPSLRNVALTAPYMHDGSIGTLEAVIEFYDAGGVDSPGKSALLAPLGLTAAEKAALAAFMRSLTGGNIARLIAQAREAGTAYE